MRAMFVILDLYCSISAHASKDTHGYVAPDVQYVIHRQPADLSILGYKKQLVQAL